MKDFWIKKIIFNFQYMLWVVLFLPILSHAKSEHRIDIYETTSDYTHYIRNPGVDTWIDNGKIHVTRYMPYCIFILADKIFTSQQLTYFFDKLAVTSLLNGKEKILPLKKFNGTWVYVDEYPEYGAFNESTQYRMKTKDGSTFGQLIRNMGATHDSEIIWLHFDNGCASLAVRPYLPKSKQPLTLKPDHNFK